MEYLINIQLPTGCKVIDTCFVKIFKEAAIYVPKAWSPNNDGHNDKLYPIIVGMIELKNSEYLTDGAYWFLKLLSTKMVGMAFTIMLLNPMKRIPGF